MEFFTQTKLPKKQNSSLNALKCLAIFAIICLHMVVFPLTTKSVIIDSLSRFGAPVFFLIAGFYSYFNNDQNKALAKYKTRIIRLIKLLIIANIIFFIYMNIHKDIAASIMSMIDIKNIFTYIIFNVSPTGPHLWFIESLIYCYILYYILSKFNINPNKLYKYIPILLLLGFIIGEFSASAGLVFPKEYYRNFIFMGLPFFTLGYLIHDKESIIDKISNKSLIYITLLGCVLSVIEGLTIPLTEIYVGSILIATCLFIWCIKNPDRIDFKITSFIGGKLYASMYVLHFMILHILVPKYFDFGYFNPIFIFIATAIVSAIVYLFVNVTKLNRFY